MVIVIRGLDLGTDTACIHNRECWVGPQFERVWSRFTIRVTPTSIKDEDGVLQLLVCDPQTGTDQLIVEATGEFGNAGYLDPSLNTGPSPGTALQYFKLGPYRDKLALWGSELAAIHVRNIKRGDWQEGAKLRQEMNSRVA